MAKKKNLRRAKGRRPKPEEIDHLLRGDRKQTEAFQNELQEEMRREMMDPQIDDRVQGMTAGSRGRRR